MWAPPVVRGRCIHLKQEIIFPFFLISLSIPLSLNILLFLLNLLLFPTHIHEPEFAARFLFFFLRCCWVCYSFLLSLLRNEEVRVFNFLFEGVCSLLKIYIIFYFLPHFFIFLLKSGCLYEHLANKWCRHWLSKLTIVYLY
jgi:hypothetical protein